MFNYEKLDMSSTLVITTYNRSELIRLALQSVLQSIRCCGDQYEILVVDNNSSDDTAAVVQSFIGKHDGLEIRYLFEEKQGLSYARNKGINESRGCLIAFMDDDQTIEPNYLKNLERAFSETGAACVGGRILYTNAQDVPYWMVPLIETVGQIDLGSNIQYLDGKSKFLKGGNIAFDKAALLGMGGFDVALGRRGNELMGAEEEVLQSQLVKTGKRVAYHPDLIQYNTLLPEKFSKSYWRCLAFGYGKTCFRVASKEWCNARQIAGIPVSLIWTLACSVNNFIRSSISFDEPLRFQKELKIRQIVGSIYEARKIHTEASHL